MHHEKMVRMEAAERRQVHEHAQAVRQVAAVRKATEARMTPGARARRKRRRSPCRMDTPRRPRHRPPARTRARGSIRAARRATETPGTIRLGRRPAPEAPNPRRARHSRRPSPNRRRASHNPTTTTSIIAYGLATLRLAGREAALHKTFLLPVPSSVPLGRIRSLRRGLRYATLFRVFSIIPGGVRFTILPDWA